MSTSAHHTPLLTGLDVYKALVSAKTTWIFLRLQLNDGSAGWGEATLFGREAELAALAQALGHSLKQQPAAGLADALARLRQSEMGLARRVLSSALEQAFLDGVARQAGMTMSAVLGGPERREVPFYANINRGIKDRSPEGFAAQAQQMLTETGARAIKIAPFDGLHWQRTTPRSFVQLMEQGVARVAAVREAVPSDTLLLVDCHARFDPFGARQMLAELAPLNIFWIEEPCDMERLSIAEQRALRSQANDAGMRLAGAENVTSMIDMSRLVHAGGHDVVLPDLRLTGVRSGMAMLALAADHNMGVSLHNPVGPVLDAISQQVAASLPSFMILERQVGESSQFQAIRGGSLPLVNQGNVVPGEQPGFGFEPALSSVQWLDAATPAVDASTTLLSQAGLPGAGPDA